MIGGFVDFVVLVIGCDAPVKKSVAETIKHLDCRTEELPMIVGKTNTFDVGTIMPRRLDENALYDSRSSQLIEIEKMPSQLGTKPLKIRIVFEFLPNMPVLNELKLGNCCGAYNRDSYFS